MNQMQNGNQDKYPWLNNPNGNQEMPKDNVAKGYRVSHLENFTPEQMELYQSQFPHLSPESFLSMLASGDQSMFEQMEAPAMKQFQQLQSQTGSQFSGMGMGAQGGSGFRNQLNQQTSDFAQELQAKRMGIQNQAIKDLMGMSNTILNQRTKDKAITEKPMSFGKQLTLAVAPAVVKSIGNAVSPMSGMFGGG